MARAGPVHVLPNRARKEAALVHPQMLPSLTVGVGKAKVLTHSPPAGPRRNGHAPGYRPVGRSESRASAWYNQGIASAGWLMEAQRSLPAGGGGLSI